MADGTEDPDHPAEWQFRRWLRAGLTGCFFAKAIAKDGTRLALLRDLEEPDERLVPNLDVMFEQSRVAGRVPVVLFPRVRHSREIVRLLNVLAEGERWTVRPAEYPPNVPEGPLGVELMWRTADDLQSQAMGFAPLGSMPVTRRAPYAAIALWPGGKDNPEFSQGPKNVVSFADARSGITGDAHAKTWEKSEADTRRLLSDPADSSIALRKVAFCLPRTEVEEAASWLGT